MTSSMPPPPPSPPPPAPPPPRQQPVTSGHPVQLSVGRSAKYSRGLAVLGLPFLYGRYLALLPVYIVLLFVGIAAFFAAWISQFVVLLSGRYPEGVHQFVTGVLRMGARAYAFAYGVTDRYPSFSLQESPPGASVPPTVHVSIEYQHGYSRGLAALGCIFFVGRAIALIPIFVVLYVIGIAAEIVAWILQFAVLFTGSYPEGGHSFLTGFLRLTVRMQAWLYGLTDRYPSFSLQP